MAVKINVLERQLLEMQNYIAFKDQCNSAVSNAPVGWHLAHNIQVINSVMKTLESSIPKDYKYQLSLSQIIVFVTRRIPRGKVKAPKSVMPNNNIFKGDLESSLQEAVRSVQIFYTLSPKSHFRHPYFKNLDRNESKKFLEIHTSHHLRIIREILA